MVSVRASRQAFDEVPENGQSRARTLRHALLPILYRYGRAIAGLVVFALILAWVALAMVPRTYMAAASVLVDVAESERDPAPPTPAIRRQAQSIASPTIGRRVVEQLKLHGNPEFTEVSLLERLAADLRAMFRRAPVDQASRNLSQALSYLNDNLDVRPRPRAGIVDVTFTSRDAATAARVANAVADAFVDEQRARRADASLQSSTALREPMEAARKALQDAESALAAHRADHSAADRDRRGRRLALEIAALDEQLSHARAAAAEAQSRLDAAQKASASVADAETGGVNPVARLRARYAALARAEARLSDDYGDRHPFLQRARAQLANLEREIGAAVSRNVARERQDFQAIADHAARLEADLAALREQAAKLDQADGRGVELVREVERRRAQLDTVRAQYQDLADRQGGAIGNPIVAAAAFTPGQPDGPAVWFWLLAAGLAALGLGAAAVFVLERADYSYRTCGEVERDLPTACLGVVPNVGRPRFANWLSRIIGRSASISGERDALNRPSSPFAVAVRNLAAMLWRAPPAQPGEIVMVTSATTDEGAATLAANLAQVASKAGRRTLLIDGNFTKPSISEIYGRPIGRLVAALRGEFALAAAVARDPASGLHRLTEKGRHALLSAIADADDRLLAAMLEQCRRAFTLVVVAGPPILLGSRSGRIFTLSDRALLVIAWRRTPRETVTAALRALGAGINTMAGVVLNRVDMAEYRLYGEAPPNRQFSAPSGEKLATA